MPMSNKQWDAMMNALSYKCADAGINEPAAMMQQLKKHWDNFTDPAWVDKYNAECELKQLKEQREERADLDARIAELEAKL